MKIKFKRKKEVVERKGEGFRLISYGKVQNYKKFHNFLLQLWHGKVWLVKKKRENLVLQLILQLLCYNYEWWRKKGSSISKW